MIGYMQERKGKNQAPLLGSFLSDGIHTLIGENIRFLLLSF